MGKKEKGMKVCKKGAMAFSFSCSSEHQKSLQVWLSYNFEYKQRSFVTGWISGRMGDKRLYVSFACALSFDNTSVKGENRCLDIVKIYVIGLK